MGDLYHITVLGPLLPSGPGGLAVQLLYRTHHFLNLTISGLKFKSISRTLPLDFRKKKTKSLLWQEAKNPQRSEEAVEADDSTNNKCCHGCRQELKKKKPCEAELGKS